MNLKELTHLVESELSRKASSLKGEPDELYAPVRYILEEGGKRLRPLLVLQGYSLFDHEIHNALPAACAMELFHNFTLVHDDIMDQAPIRRGKATVHKKWNPNTAILSGDAMLVLVYEWLAENPKRLPEVIRFFNRGALKVCEGQQLDMLFESEEEVTLSAYLNMIRLKTGELLGTSLGIGALLAGAETEQAEKLREIGVLQGVVFQIMDDLLDVYGGEEFGKRTGGDILAGKKTWLLLRSLEIDRKKSLSAMHTAGDEAKVAAVQKVYDELEIKRQAQFEVNRFSDEARRLLESIKGNSEAKKKLDQFFSGLLARVS